MDTSLGVPEGPELLNFALFPENSWKAPSCKNPHSNQKLVSFSLLTDNRKEKVHKNNEGKKSVMLGLHNVVSELFKPKTNTADDLTDKETGKFTRPISLIDVNIRDKEFSSNSGINTSVNTFRRQMWISQLESQETQVQQRRKFSASKFCGGLNKTRVEPIASSEIISKRVEVQSETQGATNVHTRKQRLKSPVQFSKNRISIQPRILSAVQRLKYPKARGPRDSTAPVPNSCRPAPSRSKSCKRTTSEIMNEMNSVLSNLYFLPPVGTCTLKENPCSDHKCSFISPTKKIRKHAQTLRYSHLDPSKEEFKTLLRSSKSDRLVEAARLGYNYNHLSKTNHEKSLPMSKITFSKSSNLLSESPAKHAVIQELYFNDENDHIISNDFYEDRAPRVAEVCPFQDKLYLGQLDPDLISLSGNKLPVLMKTPKNQDEAQYNEWLVSATKGMSRYKTKITKATLRRLIDHNDKQESLIQKLEEHFRQATEKEPLSCIVSESRVETLMPKKITDRSSTPPLLLPYISSSIDSTDYEI